MSEAPESPKDIKVLKETCQNKDSCNNDVCTPNDCKRYRSPVSARVSEVNGFSFWWYKSDVTGKEVGPYERDEADCIKIAQELGVHPREVFRRMANDERISDKKREELEGQPTPLQHLNEVENPTLAGKVVQVEGVVASTSVAYLVPAEVTMEFEWRGETADRSISIDATDPVNIKFVAVNDEVKLRRLKQAFHVSQGRITKVDELASRTVYKVRVRPPVFTLEKRGDKIVDEKGFEYKALDIYVVAEKDIVFHPSSLMQLEGFVVPNPRSQRITLLVYAVEFPGEAHSFDVAKLQRLVELFRGKSVKARLKWVLDEFEKFSQLVGRQNLATAGLLAYFTPMWIRFNSEVQKGWGNVLFVGDTTTGKTETLRKLIRLLSGGMLVTAETASTVGLTGTATQVEQEGWFVEWGFLVLCDRKLLAIDGAHKLSLSNWAALAESERTGVVAIVKAAKDSAYARTRQVKVANPVDREGSNKFATQTLASFLHPCQALGTVFDKTSIARLDLAVFSDQRDVAPKEINRKLEGSYDSHLLLLGEVLKWCWSGESEVKFTEEAVSTLLDEATTLYDTFFTEAIPLVSIDQKWKLARLSSALAYLTLSTEDFKTVTVTEEHVREVADFLRDEYAKAGLNILAKETRFEKVTLEDVQFTLARVSNAADLEVSDVEKIYKFIVIQGRVTRDQLKAAFELSDKNQLRPLLATLSSEDLIRTGRGFYPTQKLIESYKLLNFATIAAIAMPPEGPPQVSETKNSEGSSHEVGNTGNLGKIAAGPPGEVSLDDLVSCHWANSLYGKRVCGVCGYEKWTCWQGETTKGDKIPVCNDCSRQYLQGREAP